MSGNQLMVFMVGLVLAVGGTMFTVLNDFAWYTIALQVLGVGLLGGLAAKLVAEVKDK